MLASEQLSGLLISDAIGIAKHSKGQDEARPHLAAAALVLAEEVERLRGLVDKHSSGAKLDSMVEPVVALSTAHLTPSALEWMNRTLLREGNFDSTCFSDGAPEEVRVLAQWAVDNGVEWLTFDPEGIEIEGLPTFEHG